MDKIHIHAAHQPSMEFPEDFRCPISMELMKDPVTIATGFTYERKNIDKWFHTYRKKTCPATMQPVHDQEMTPNHTLKRLIMAWSQSNMDSAHSPRPPPPSDKQEELGRILGEIETTPFKVRSLRKLRSIVEVGDEVKEDFKRLGGVDVVVRMIGQILVDYSDFLTFRACEEALGILHLIPISDEDDPILHLLTTPNSVKSMAVMLRRGGAEARFCAISIFQKISAADYHWNQVVSDQQCVDFFKSLLEIVSDEICTKASAGALQLLVNILGASKKARLKAIEAGAICTLIELLPDSSSRSRSEKIMMLIKLLCECAEGRLAFSDHDLGIPAVAKKLLDVSTAATKIGVKIVWLIASFHPTEKVLEELLACGAVKKLVALLHIGGEGQSRTKERVVKVLKLHGRTWRRHPCFPGDVREYLGLGNDDTR